MAMQYDGKTYRNLQEQVAYLTAKWQQLADEIDEVRAQIPSKMIVEELPEEGDPLITYYVGPKGTEPNLYYEVWVWVQEEPDGPFVWRELEDTDQVDLSGYLPIQDGVTPNQQAYCKNADGTQQMINIVRNADVNSIPVRGSNAELIVRNVPTDDKEAVPKKYIDDGFVAKQTGSTTFRQAYVKAQDGSQILVDMDANAATPYSIAVRDGSGRINCADPSSDSGAVNRGYADGRYLAKQTDTSTYYRAYCKAADGSQTMWSITGSSAAADTIVARDANGRIICADPSAANHAATKAYVDAAVGQLLYLHDIEIIVTVDATNKLYIRAYLINGSSTAISSIDRATFSRMDVQYGCFGVNIETGTACAVTKCPDGFRQDEFEEPYPAYLYQYMSGGSLVSGVTTNAMSVTVTDSVITF